MCTNFERLRHVLINTWSFQNQEKKQLIKTIENQKQNKEKDTK